MIKQLFTSLFVLLFIYASDGATHGAAKDDKAAGKTTAGTVPGITASADKNKVHIGDTINLTLKYFIPEGSTFAPDTDLTGIDGLTIISKRPAEGEIILAIMIDKTASFEIGPVSLSFKDSNGVLNIIRSEVLHIEVLSNLGDRPAEAQLKPISDIIPTYPLILKLLPWIIGAIILIAAGAALYFRKKRKRQKAEALRDIKPAHVIAKEEIEKLNAMRLTDKGEYKEFYFRFSEILRQYIERLRGFPAAELTTEEIARRIKEERDRKLVPILRDADLVKFADAIPTTAKTDEDVRAALEYIKATTPVPVVNSQQRES